MNAIADWDEEEEENVQRPIPKRRKRKAPYEMCLLTIIKLRSFASESCGLDLTPSSVISSKDFTKQEWKLISKHSALSIDDDSMNFTKEREYQTRIENLELWKKIQKNLRVYCKGQRIHCVLTCIAAGEAVND